MEEIYGKLFARLNGKGLRPVEISRLIKDVSRILEGARDPLRLKVNRRLNLLGWRKDLVDGFTFELILHLLENQDAKSGKISFKPISLAGNSTKEH